MSQVTQVDGKVKTKLLSLNLAPNIIFGGGFNLPRASWPDELPKSRCSNNHRRMLNTLNSAMTYFWHNMSQHPPTKMVIFWILFSQTKPSSIVVQNYQFVQYLTSWYSHGFNSIGEWRIKMKKTSWTQNRIQCTKFFQWNHKLGQN